MPDNRITLTRKSDPGLFAELALHAQGTGYLWITTPDGTTGFPLTKAHVDQMRRTFNRHERQNKKG